MSDSWSRDGFDPTAQPIDDSARQPYLDPDDADSGDVGPDLSYGEVADPTEAPDVDDPPPAPPPPRQVDPVQPEVDVDPVTVGPLTTGPTGAARDVLPGITDVAGDLGHALGVGSDELGLVEVEVNGLLGVRVHLEPGLVPYGTEQAGHWLAAALEEARREVVGHLHDHFRGNPVTAQWLDSVTTADEDDPVGNARPASARQRVASSPDGVVSVVVAPDGSIASVLVTGDEFDLPTVAESFVRAAESALQGNEDDQPGLQLDNRMARFDAAIARIDKSLDNLDAQLDTALKRL